MASKKAQRIFHDTYETLRTYVRQGKNFDSLSGLVCTTKYDVTKATIADLEALCKKRFAYVERHLGYCGDRPSCYTHEVEVCRRTWLTIKSTEEDVLYWGSVQTR